MVSVIHGKTKITNIKMELTIDRNGECEFPYKR